MSTIGAIRPVGIVIEEAAAMIVKRQIRYWVFGIPSSRSQRLMPSTQYL
ncbi:hypothetical protein D3OALGA1CA_4282 [Olavius algarvensis associated proteobacterium Delta 3]|nr:hypothetical protein D3OALGA1CA_4282 [Olavius algarvensis associated proteobacterium Delta 3]